MKTEVGGSPELTLYTCPNGCGWYRRITPNYDWNAEMIMHPLYGRIANADAANRDVNHHNCDAHKAAVARLRRY